MIKFLNYRAVNSLLIGVLSIHIFAGRSLALEPQATITARSCAGLGNSLTKDDIELRGARLGFALDANTMGAAFENFVFDSLQISRNTTYFPSPVRQAATTQAGGTVQSGIIPDSVGPIIVADTTFTYVRSYSNSYFVEIKFTRGNIFLSSFDHQIIGYIDVARRSPAGVAPASLGTLRPTPTVEFVTTSDTVVGPSVITTANQEKVLIAQRIVCDAPSTPSPTDMIVGSRQLLNPEVLASRFEVPFKGSGRVSGLR